MSKPENLSNSAWGHSQQGVCVCSLPCENCKFGHLYDLRDVNEWSSKDLRSRWLCVHVSCLGWKYSRLLFSSICQVRGKPQRTVDNKLQRTGLKNSQIHLTALLMSTSPFWNIFKAPAHNETFEQLYYNIPGFLFNLMNKLSDHFLLCSQLLSEKYVFWPDSRCSARPLKIQHFC